MSEDTSLTTGAPWHGTQMKPDIFEPFTAEWAGRAAKNQCWLFQRQQQTIFTEGADRQYAVPYSGGAYWGGGFQRRFWINEGIGTLMFRCYYTEHYVASGVLAATLRIGHGPVGDWSIAGTSDATWDSSGWKNLLIYLDPDWHKDSASLDHAWLSMLTYMEPLVPGEDCEMRFSYLSLTGFPRT